jgi:hypothetical protein
MAARQACWKRIVPAATLTALPFTVLAPTAQAFFPPITPAPPVTVVQPPVPPPVLVIPPVSPPPFVPPPTVVPPVVPPPVIVPPTTPAVPEPSTLVATFAGLAAAAGWAARRRKRMKDEAAPQT